MSQSIEQKLVDIINSEAPKYDTHFNLQLENDVVWIPGIKNADIGKYETVDHYTLVATRELDNITFTIYLRSPDVWTTKEIAEWMEETDRKLSQ